jgi:hypothetical protein
VFNAVARQRVSTALERTGLPWSPGEDTPLSFRSITLN